MKLHIDNNPDLEVVLRTPNGRAAVRIPIRKGGFKNTSDALLAAARAALALADNTNETI